MTMPYENTPNPVPHVHANNSESASPCAEPSTPQTTKLYDKLGPKQTKPDKEMSTELSIKLNAVQQLDPEGARMARQIHDLGHAKYKDGWYSELAAKKYSECKAWMEAYDKAHAAKNERELKAKALAAEIKAIRMEFSKEVLNSLLRHYVPNLHSLLKAEEPTDPAQAQAEAEDESNEPHSSPTTKLFVVGFIHTFH